MTVDFDEFAYGVGNETVASVLDAQVKWHQCPSAWDRLFGTQPMIFVHG